jgi:protein-L-isoaspartate(D-aspartate) O-methyltransferase
VGDFASQRATMVERQLRGRGIHDERVLAAMGEVPREAFLPEDLRGRAYEDSALPIHGRQTISQPWIVAAIAQALALGGEERVLEIGTGSGYSTCVLSALAGEVISIERLEVLSSSAGEALAGLGVENVELIVGDGSKGLTERAPYRAIAVHATAPGPPPALLEQLGEGGRLVVPVVQEGEELLTAYCRSGGRLRTVVIGPCRFVPLIGEQGY